MAKRILAIEYNSDSLIGLTSVLRKLIPGCAVMVAQSGADAIEKAIAEIPDAILINIDMAKIDRFGVCKKLKSEERTKHIPIVMFSAVETDFCSHTAGLKLGSDPRPIEETEPATVSVALCIQQAEGLVHKKTELLEAMVEERTKELRASQERCRRITEAVTDYIFTVRIEGGHPVETIHRPGCVAVTGYTPEEYAADPYLWIRMVHEDERRAVEEQARHLLSGEDAVPVEHRITRKDGCIRWVKNTLVPHYDAQGNFLSYDGLIRDINERKRAEEALRVSEEKFRLAFENAVDAIFWADPATGLITNCNKAAENLLERKRYEITGQHQTILHPPQKTEHYSSMFRRHTEKKEAIDTEAEVITKSGRIIPVHIAASVTLVEGKPIIQGIFRNITERKRADEALQESEKKYSTLVENSPTGVYISQGGKIVFVNARLAEIYGYPKEELVGMAAWRLVHADSDTLTEQRAADVPPEYEAKGLTRDGETIWVKSRNTRIEYKGKPAILGNIVNITQQRQAEEKLRKINEELKNFVRVVSHDLKTPTISIQGFSSRLLKNCGKELGEKGRNYLEQIDACARRMEVFISDLLALSKIGRVLSTFKHISSFDIVQSVILDLQDRLEKNRIELVVANSLPTVYCDGARVYQIFENLLINAIKFTVGTENPKIEIGYEEKVECHQFYVKDNGIGIDLKYHGKVFEMFHRLKEIRDEEGTGLGLTIVNRIVTGHGGKVWVESEKGKGATFYFTLARNLSGS